MMILLPNNIDDLHSLEQKLDWNTVLNTHLRRSKVELFLPKFKLEIKLNLKQTLEKVICLIKYKNSCKLYYFYIKKILINYFIH